MGMTLRDAKVAVARLHVQLIEIARRDQEQEVRGIAVPVLDAVLATARDAMPSDQILAAMPDVISPETIAEGEPIRAVDALVVVGQLDAALDRAIRRERKP